MNVRELKEFLTEFNNEVEVVLMDKCGRVYELNDDHTLESNVEIDGFFEPTMYVGLIAGDSVPRWSI